MPKSVQILFIIIVAGLPTQATQAQPGFLLHVEDPIYLSIDRLQLNGFLLELNPTVRPYSESDVRMALDHVDRTALDPFDMTLIKRIENRLTKGSRGSKLANVGVRFRPGAIITNNSRLDPLRYLSDGDNHVFEYASLQLRFGVGRISSALAIRHDLFYDQDPDGLDTALRWLSRTEDSYIRYDGGLIGFELGRFSRHWGLSRQAGLVVSSNPRSYDQIGFRIGGSRLAIHSILGELDSITADGRYTGIAGDDSVATGSERRYVAAHRLDWRPRPNIQIYFLQSTLYSGANAGVSLKYLNPFHSVIFALDSVPKNEENNGFVGMGAWIQSGKTTLHFQGVVDDVDVLNLSEPLSFAVTGSANIAGVSRGIGFQTGFEAVASRAYNTLQEEGRYLYLLRGLGTQFSDYVSFFMQTDIDATWIRGLSFSPRVDVLLQGEADIRYPFPADDLGVGAILSGTVEKTVRGALLLTYEPEHWLFIRLDAGVNKITDSGHDKGSSLSKFVALLEVGLRFSLDHEFSLDFQR